MFCNGPTFFEYTIPHEIHPKCVFLWPHHRTFIVWTLRNTLLWALCTNHPCRDPHRDSREASLILDWTAGHDRPRSFRVAGEQKSALDREPNFAPTCSQFSTWLASVDLNLTPHNFSESWRRRFPSDDKPPLVQFWKREPSQKSRIACFFRSSRCDFRCQAGVSQGSGVADTCILVRL